MKKNPTLNKVTKKKKKKHHSVLPQPHEISCSKLGCVRLGMTPVYATKLNNNNPVQPKAAFPLGGIFRTERLKMERFDWLK